MLPSPVFNSYIQDPLWMPSPGNIQEVGYFDMFSITTLCHSSLRVIISFGGYLGIIFSGSALPSMAYKQWSTFTMASTRG